MVVRSQSPPWLSLAASAIPFVIPSGNRGFTGAKVKLNSRDCYEAVAHVVRVGGTHCETGRLLRVHSSPPKGRVMRKRMRSRLGRWVATSLCRLGGTHPLTVTQRVLRLATFSLKPGMVVAQSTAPIHSRLAALSRFEAPVLVCPWSYCSVVRQDKEENAKANGRWQEKTPGSLRPPGQRVLPGTSFDLKDTS